MAFAAAERAPCHRGVSVTDGILAKIKRLTGWTWEWNGRGFHIELGKRRRRLCNAWMAEPRFNGRAVTYSYMRTFVWKRAFGRFRLLPEREANPHTVILGASGYGKSTLLKTMIREIAGAGKPIVLFDGHSEHEALIEGLGGKAHDASRENINIFALDGLTISQRIEELANLLSDVYGLGYLQRVALNSALYYTYRKCVRDMNGSELSRVPTLRDLVGELSIFANNAKGAAERERLEHIRQRVASLQKCMPISSHVGMDGLASGINSFSLSGIQNTEAKVIYMHEAVKRLYGAMRGNQMERGIRLYIIIDESRFLLDNAGALLTSLVNEGRKFGYAIVIVTNSSAMLPKDIIANSATFIAFHINEPSEINYVASAIAKGDAFRANVVRGMLERLGINEAIVSGREGAVVVRTRAAKPPNGDGNGAAIVAKPANVSDEHEERVREISERLGGLHIRHYVNRRPGGPDIVAYAGGRIAIEYETGRKNFGETAAMIRDRSGAYSRTIVVVNDDHASRYAGLSGNRIEVLPFSRLGALSP